MANYLNLFERVREDCKDIDSALANASSMNETRDILESGNHFMLRHIATNTAVLVDMIDRIVEDYEPIDITSNDVADALIDAFLRKKGQSKNDT